MGWHQTGKAIQCCWLQLGEGKHKQRRQNVLVKMGVVGNVMGWHSLRKQFSTMGAWGKAFWDTFAVPLSVLEIV